MKSSLCIAALLIALIMGSQAEDADTPRRSAFDEIKEALPSSIEGTMTSMRDVMEKVQGKAQQVFGPVAVEGIAKVKEAQAKMEGIHVELKGLLTQEDKNLSTAVHNVAKSLGEFKAIMEAAEAKFTRVQNETVQKYRGGVAASMCASAANVAKSHGEMYELLATEIEKNTVFIDVSDA